MTIELTYMAWTALLTAALWIPYIISQVQTNGLLASENYRDPKPRDVPLWGKRANRAHINAVETFAPFAALILAIDVSGSESSMTALWAAVFFYARLIHAIVFLLAIPYLRTVIFTVGFVAVVGLFWELVM